MKPARRLRRAGRTGDPRVPLVLVMRDGMGRDGQRVLVVEKGTPPELTVRLASKATIASLSKRFSIDELA